MDAFVSYSRVDSAWVDELHAALRRCDVDAWIDRRDLPVALPWLEEVKDGIEGAGFVVRCRSADFDRSEHCAAEVSLAERLGVPMVDVEVGEAEVVAAQRVVDRLAQESPDSRSSRLLLASARAWERRGRPRRSLMSAREFRRLRNAPRPRDERAGLVDRFVRTSRRRLRMRRSAVLVAAFVVYASVASAGRIREINEDDRETTAQLLRRTDELSERRLLATGDVYTALEVAAGLGGSEAAFDASPLTLALDVRTPVDAFEVPSRNPLRFGAGPVSDVITVVDSRGAGYSRRDDATPGRAPDPAEIVPRMAGGLATDGVTAVVEDTMGRPERRITLERPATMARRSPDGRMVAAMSGDAIDVYDIETGRRVVRLEGGGAPLYDLVWAADSSRVWGAGVGKVVGWQVRVGEVLVDDPALQFRSVMPDDERLWVLEESGRLLDVGLTGEINGTIDLGFAAYHAAMNELGSTIIATGSGEVAIVDLTSGRVRAIELTCSGHQPVFLAADRAAVSCDAGLAVVDTTTATIIRTIGLPFELTGQPVAQVDALGPVMVSVNGTLSRIDEGGPSPLLGGRSIPCGGRWSGITVSPAGSIHPYGQRIGQIGCTAIAVPDGSGHRWQVGGFEVEPTYRSRAATFDPAGDMILTTLADGSVVVWPAENITPQRRLTPVSGDVFDLAVDGSDVYAATRTGMLVRFSLPAMPSNEVMAAEAQARLDHARAIGVYSGR